MAKRTLDERIDAGEFIAYIDSAAFNAERFDVPGLVKMTAELGHCLYLTAENTATRNGPDRRGRASALSALKRAIERETGTRLTLATLHHSETYGFKHATYAAYVIERTDT